jgi:hypothetical protein
MRIDCGRRFVWVVALIALANTAIAKDPSGFDPANASALQGLPVEVVLIGDHVREEIPSVMGYSEKAIVSRTTVPPGQMVRELPNQGLGTIIGEAIIYKLSKTFSRPAVSTLRAAHCELPANDEMAKAVEDSVHASTWGANATVNRHVMPNARVSSIATSLDNKVDEIVPGPQARYVITVSYSLSADFSYLVVSGDASAYSQSLPGAPGNWEHKPAWVDHFMVVSDAVPTPEKSQAEIDKLLADEDVRYAATGVNELLVLADKKDDYDAHLKAVSLKKDHESRQADIRVKEWMSTEAAEMRSRQWSENGCARVKDALHADTADLQKLLTTLFTGQIPNPGEGGTALGPDYMQEPGAPGDRQIMTSPGHYYVLRRSGDKVALMYRYSLFPDGPEEKDKKED